MKNLSLKKFIAIHVLLAFIALSVTIYAQAESTSLPEVMIAGTVEVSPRDRISLYDIVEVRGGNPAVIEELKKRLLTVNDSRIQRSTMLEALKGLRARFVLPESVKLIFSNQSVSRLELERKIKSQLLSRCSTCEYQIFIQNVPRGITANWTLELNVDLNKETSMIPIRSPQQYKDINNVPQDLGSQWVVVEIKKYAEVPVVTRNVPANTSIDSSMYKMERRVLRPTMDLLMSEKDLNGMQTARHLSMGQTISSRDLKKEQIIRKSQIVKAQVDRSGFELSITAIAEDSGAIGDIIRVRNIDSQKVFAAEILAKGLVKIE